MGLPGSVTAQPGVSADLATDRRFVPPDGLSDTSDAQTLDFHLVDVVTLTFCEVAVRSA